MLIKKWRIYTIPYSKKPSKANSSKNNNYLARRWVYVEFRLLKEKQSFTSFANACFEAEKAMQVSPATVAILSRRALELAVKWVYQFDNDVRIPYQDNLSSLIHNRHFLGIIDEELLPMMKYVVKLGNAAVHTNVAITRDGNGVVFT